MITELKNILKVNSLNHFLRDDIQETVSLVKSHIYKNRIPNGMTIITQIDQLLNTSRIKREHIFSDSGQKNIKEFTDHGYIYDNGVIIWKSYVPIEVVTCRYNETYIVDQEVFKRNGIGVTEFRIYLDRQIYDVYCSGVHPNLNNKTHKFCMSSEVTFKEVHYSNVESFVKGALSHINLSFSYWSFEATSKIKELVCRNR